MFTRLILDVGVDETFDMATRLGISMPPSTPSVDADASSTPRPAARTASRSPSAPSRSSPLEMASAYGVFANHGRRAPPTPVLRVLDPDGEPC